MLLEIKLILLRAASKMLSRETSNIEFLTDYRCSTRFRDSRFALLIK